MPMPQCFSPGAVDASDFQGLTTSLGSGAASGLQTTTRCRTKERCAWSASVAAPFHAQSPCCSPLGGFAGCSPGGLGFRDLGRQVCSLLSRTLTARECLPDRFPSASRRADFQVEGVKSVQRVVCGGCLDFKAHGIACIVDAQGHVTPQTLRNASQVVVKLPADKFGDWENAGFAPEECS